MSNLAGNKIDKLEVIELLVSSPSYKRKYLCKCECGNSCTRLERTLKNKKHVSSCGCISKKYLVPGDRKICSNAGKHRKDSFINGSNIQMTFRKGTISTNTSGIQGISWSKTVNKWHVYIGYQNYRATLGFYENLEDAKHIRTLAEDAIKDNCFEEFYFSVRGKELQSTKKIIK